MLVGLSIRGIVLIDKLDIEFGPGLWTLTGETGAGKSILLDALGLATGARADRALIRQNQDQASAAAEFDIHTEHIVWSVLERHGLGSGPNLILRRIQMADGRSRAFINDQPVGIATLKEVGDCLIEVHGQKDDRVLLNTALHRELLDEFGALETETRKISAAHEKMVAARKSLEQREAETESAIADLSYLRHAVEEIDHLSPVADEEAKLVDERRLLMSAEKISSALNEARRSLIDDGGSVGRLNSAIKRLEKETGEAADLLKPITSVLDRALVETQDATETVQNAMENFRFDQDRLNVLEERLFALRALARKHDITVAELSAARDQFAKELIAVDTAQDKLDALKTKLEQCRSTFMSLATVLSAKRHDAAERLDNAVTKELKRLKLDHAAFHTRIDVLGEERAGTKGLDRVKFEVSTNPGAPVGPLTQIASGGELSRFVLALKVAIARKGVATTLIFDEVDRGVGGAVADAVGERLQRLAESGQVLIVTHSPQVAARASHHLRIDKKTSAKRKAIMSVKTLNRNERQEEIARMLSAAEVTGEARAAAESLLSTSEQIKKTGISG